MTLDLTTTTTQAHYRALLVQLVELHGGYGALGQVLAQIARRELPYSRQHMESLAKGRKGFTVTLPIARALDTLAAMADNVSSVQAAAHEVGPLLSIHELPPYTVILAPARQCELPGCRIWFVAAGRQRFCSAECRAEHRRRVREMQL